MLTYHDECVRLGDSCGREVSLSVWVLGSNPGGQVWEQCFNPQVHFAGPSCLGGSWCMSDRPMVCWLGHFSRHLALCPFALLLHSSPTAPFIQGRLCPVALAFVPPPPADQLPLPLSHHWYGAVWRWSVFSPPPCVSCLWWWDTAIKPLGNLLLKQLL